MTGTRTRAGGTTTHRANRYTITAVRRTRDYSLFINSTGPRGDLCDQRIEAVPSIVVRRGDSYSSDVGDLADAQHGSDGPPCRG